MNLNEQQNARVSIKRRRFLYRASRKPSSVYVTIYLGSALPRGSSDYGERDGQPLNAPISILLRVGFTGTRRVSAPPVGSYPAFPSLPHNAAVYFCCTFLKVAFTGRYPAPLSCGARTFLTIIQWIARSLGLLDQFLFSFPPHQSASLRSADSFPSRGSRIESDHSPLQRILAQFSHSIIPLPEANFFIVFIGRLIPQPEQRLSVTRATGFGYFFLIVL